MPQSTAVVATETPQRYAKQLRSHLGRKREWTPLGEDGCIFTFDYGVGTVTTREGAVVLEARADDDEGLARVQDVLGRHLERFGARNELVVSWTSQPA